MSGDPTLDQYHAREPESEVGVRRRLRDQMPVIAEYAYFDHAAVAPIPKRAADAMTKYASQASSFGDAKWPEWAEKVEALRGRAAELLRAKASEIALLSNTTQGINLVAAGLPWQAGDNVVVPANEFPSNLIPWRSLSSRGVEVRELQVPATGDWGIDLLQSAVDHKTRLVALSWVGYASGFRINVAEVVEFARSFNSLVLLDAIQGLGAFPIDVAECGVDFVAADGHKWMLGPEGAALFYCREELLNRLGSIGIGWNSLSQGAFDGLPHKLKDTAARFEGGTMNVPGCHGLNESLGVLLEMGINENPCLLSQAILENVAELETKLRNAGFEVLLPTKPENRSGIVGVTWPAARQQVDLLNQARRHLLRSNIITSVRSNRIRLSTHAYNHSAEIDRLVVALSKFAKST